MIMKFNITPVTVMLSAYDGDQRAGERVVLSVSSSEQSSCLILIATLSLASNDYSAASDWLIRLVVPTFLAVTQA